MNTKRLFTVFLFGLLCAFFTFNLSAQESEGKFANVPVQVVSPTGINLPPADTAWLPDQIQEKLKSNLQEFLSLKIVVNSEAEKGLKKIQSESESSARNEATAIELGKITTARYGLFTKIRKTGAGYTVSVDFTDLTTGEQIASVTSKEYAKAEYLYGSTGAVDEITLALGNKLKIKVSDMNRNLLASGSSSFSVDQQLALVKQNQEQFKRQMAQYDADLERLKLSNDIAAIESKNRIEAEKAILKEKQNAEAKRQEELRVQQKRAEEDAKLEAERSIALKNQRDKMAKQAAEKAAEVRKLKMERQGVLGQINVIEAKKKALVDIRQGVENRSNELYEQMIVAKIEEEHRIKNKEYISVELDAQKKPTEQAIARRKNQIIKNDEDLSNKFFTDCAAVKAATANMETGLLNEIRADVKALSTKRTVSSMGDELKVWFGNYDGGANGWRAELSLYSDGVQIFSGEKFVVNYEALSGKKAPNLETEMDDAVLTAYANDMEMYNSLLSRGEPIIYFEIDYNVIAEPDDKPSTYKINLNTLRVINTISGKVTQTSTLNKVTTRKMQLAYDIREKDGIVAKHKKMTEALKKELAAGKEFDEAIKEVDIDFWWKKRALEDKKEIDSARLELIKKLVGEYLVPIPGTTLKFGKTEVTQNLYEAVMGINPSKNTKLDEFTIFSKAERDKRKELQDKIEDLYRWKWKLENNDPKGKDLQNQIDKLVQEQRKAPSIYKLEESCSLPVENIRGYDAVYFCNKLSEIMGLEPVYIVNGETDVTKWNYVPYIDSNSSDRKIEGELLLNLNANGFRLPDKDEWEYAAKGGEKFKFAGSDNVQDVAWVEENSESKVHAVARLKPNKYGLYDMYGNVSEMCSIDSKGYYQYGGSINLSVAKYVEGKKISGSVGTEYRGYICGFRFICLDSEKVKAKEAEVEAFAKKFMSDKMIKLSGIGLNIMKTEVTQELYEKIMDYNPSKFKGSLNPVENVSWYDAIFFCNRLSKYLGLTPVYSVNGVTDEKKWLYNPGKREVISGTIIKNPEADGFRLPDLVEWKYAAMGGKNQEYAGENANVANVAWYEKNSGKKTHPVAQKKPNGYGLYDMSGNVEEWCWNVYENDINRRITRGGDFWSGEISVRITGWGSDSEAKNGSAGRGFRIVSTDFEQKQKIIDSIPGDVNKDMVKLPGRNLEMLKTEVTQELYVKVLQYNPSYFTHAAKLPVEQVSWYDAVYFCNRLSVLMGYTPVYSINGETDVEKWNYNPWELKVTEKTAQKVEQDVSANGFRLPTEEEWIYAARCGEEQKYSGSDNADQVAWYHDNSKNMTHPVAQKKANGYGMFDMTGNVSEWMWDEYIPSNSKAEASKSKNFSRRYYGFSYMNYASKSDKASDFEKEFTSADSYKSYYDLGFRIVRKSDK